MKKSISLAIILTMIIAIFMPLTVHADPVVGRISNNIVLQESGTDTEQVSSSTDMDTYIASKLETFMGELANQNITVDASDLNSISTLFKTVEPYKYVTLDSIEIGYILIEGNLTKQYTVKYTTVNVTVNTAPAVGHNNIWATAGGKVAVLYENSENPNHDGEHYVANGEIVDYLLGDSITIKAKADDGYRFIGWFITDPQASVAENYVRTPVISTNTTYTYTPGITTVDGVDEPLNYLTAAFEEDTGNTQITGATVTLKAPKVGDKVEKVKKDDGYGEYETQSVQPTVSTTTKGLDVNAYWVQGLEDLAEEPFYGTFEEGEYYYAMIDFEAQEGYELTTTFPDGIKINGQAPDEVFAVMMGTWNHCIVKIKATTTEEEEATPSYEFIEGANQTYVIGTDDTATFRVDADFALFEDGGAVYVDDVEVDKENYTSKSGSTVITFTKEYMSSLSLGEHTLKVAFSDGGSAITKFTVAKSSETSNSPKTGDVITVWISVIGISTLVIIGSRFIKKNK